VSGVIVSEWMDFTQEYMSWVYVVADACVLWLLCVQSSKCVRRKSLPGRVHTIHTHTCMCVWYTYIYMACSMYVKLHVCMYHRIYL
jgi:hypothetical protein